MKPKILAFSGSTRKGSYNHSIVRISAQGAIQDGADVTILEPQELKLPLFCEDERDSPTDNIKKFREMLKTHQGFLISSPEYNSTITAALKNAIDWASVQFDGEAPLECFKGKIVALMSASPGALGGIRGLPQLRYILSNIQVLVLPDQQAVGKINELLDDQGNMKDLKQKVILEKLGANVSNMIKKLNGYK